MAEYTSGEFRPKERLCLQCDLPFTSYWSGNRLCVGCGGCTRGALEEALAPDPEETARKARRRERVGKVAGDPDRLRAFLVAEEKCRRAGLAGQTRR